MNLKRFGKLILLSAILSFCAVAANALPSEYYAKSSVLASGKWAMVRTTSTGMHLIPVATLRSLGFSDPSKVRVYGTGARMVPEGLSESIPDDLPLLPSVMTSKGLVFFAVDKFTWKQSYSSDGAPYSHTTNPYADSGFYFLSDRETEGDEMPKHPRATASGSGTVGSFVARLVHERDLYNPGETGRTFLGEDFRTTKSQTFSFSLPDNAGGDALATIRFGAHTSNGSSSLIFTANGKRLPLHQQRQDLGHKQR